MTTTSTATTTVTVDGIGPVPLTVTERGGGRPFLVLHGGAGPQSVDGFAELLATSGPAQVLVPVHPGFGGTERPPGLDSMKGLARLYAGLLEERDLTRRDGDRQLDRRLDRRGDGPAGHSRSACRPVDAAGLQIQSHPSADFFSLTMGQVAALSYYRPDAFRIDVASLPEPAKAMMAGNRAALQRYGGAGIADPGLLGRLPAVTVPTLVVWGEADRMIPIQHGQAYAAGHPRGPVPAHPGGRSPAPAGNPGSAGPGRPGVQPGPRGGLTAAPGLHQRATPAAGNLRKQAAPCQTFPSWARRTASWRCRGRSSCASWRTAVPRPTGWGWPRSPSPRIPRGRRSTGTPATMRASSWCGTVRFTVGEKSYDAPPRTLVMIPPGAPHTFANPGDEPAVILNTFTPDLYLQYFRDLRDMAASGQPPPAGAIESVMARYATVPATGFAP